MPASKPGRGHGGSTSATRSWWSRMAWFIAIWCLSVAALTAVAWVLKQVAA